MGAAGPDLHIIRLHVSIAATQLRQVSGPVIDDDGRLPSPLLPLLIALHHPFGSPGAGGRPSTLLRPRTTLRGASTANVQTPRASADGSDEQQRADDGDVLREQQVLNVLLLVGWSTTRNEPWPRGSFGKQPLRILEATKNNALRSLAGR